MKAKLKQYVRERDEMLKKCSVTELRKFVAEHKECYSAEYLENFSKASDDVLEATLHKMIVNVKSLPMDLRTKSALWLGMHGLSLNI